MLRPSTSMRSTLAMFAAMATLSLASCGGSEGNGNGGNGGNGGTPDAAFGGQPGESCDRATDCAGSLVCDPGTRECADQVACTEHGDCGLGSHCDGNQCTQSGATSPCADDDNCAAGDSCVVGFCGCQGEEFAAELVDVNMMILLDRSGSMEWGPDQTVPDDTPVGADDPNSRWQIALSAVKALAEEYAGQVELGLSFYPRPGSNCGVADPTLAIGQGSAEAIGNALDAASPQGGTPSGPALDHLATSEPSLHDPDTENVILYITDGEENCGPNGANSPPAPDASQVAAAGRLLEQGIRTFVVGFTNDVGIDELNATAEAGGTARDGDLKFYLANDEASLTEALNEIASLTLGCNFELSGSPARPEDLHVFADGQPISRDPTGQNGWDYSADDNRISVFGASCDRLRAGEVEQLSVVQTCDLVID
jgi:hypothetical protein